VFSVRSAVGITQENFSSCVVRDEMGERNSTYRVLVGKPEGKGPL
jgi:hypothetical protein